MWFRPIPEFSVAYVVPCLVANAEDQREIPGKRVKRETMHEFSWRVLWEWRAPAKVDNVSDCFVIEWMGCSVSSLAWFMSNQETSFVTIGQRVLASPLK